MSAVKSQDKLLIFVLIRFLMLCHFTISQIQPRLNQYKTIYVRNRYHSWNPLSRHYQRLLVGQLDKTSEICPDSQHIIPFHRGVQWTKTWFSSKYISKTASNMTSSSQAELTEPRIWQPHSSDSNPAGVIRKLPSSDKCFPPLAWVALLHRVNFGVHFPQNRFLKHSSLWTKCNLLNCVQVCLTALQTKQCRKIHIMFYRLSWS